jgi:Fur family ferric uptake transcriptional regulator
MTSTSTQDALAVFRDHLRRQQLRLTPEREAIVRAALCQAGHFGVDELTAAVRASGHEVSRATIYRALPLLLESGLIQATEVSKEGSYFEAAFGREQHDHLICRSCGTVIEFQFEAFQMLERQIAEKYGFELLGHVHELVGRCAPCRTGRSAHEVH